MFKAFNGFFALIITLVVLKWFLPPETTGLANQILVKILTIINNLLAMITLPH